MVTILTKPWIEHLEERLKTVDDFVGYLSAAFAEGKDTFYLAVRDVTLITHRRAATAALEQERNRILQAIKLLPRSQHSRTEYILLSQAIAAAIGDDKEQQR